MKYLNLFEQQLNQIIGESVTKWVAPTKKNIMEAKGHLDHPEDDVFIRNDSGATAVNAITSTAKNPKNITIKWDGYPALIFGRGPDGKFTIVDKHMFNRGVRNLNTVEDWIANEQSRGENTRSELIDIVKEIWPGLEKECRGQGYYWGDLLFRRPLTAKNGVYTFRANPNGITYTVDANSDIGKLLANKTAGIAVHQYISPNAASTDEATSLNGTIGELKNNSNVALVPSAMPVVPSINIDPTLLTRAKSSISKYAGKVQQFFDNAPQNKNAFTQLFTTYLNSRIVSGDLSNLVDGFIKWIEQRFGKQVDTDKLSTTMGAKLYDYIVSNKSYVEMAFKIWIDIYNLKNNVVSQLDQAAKASPVKGFLDDGTETQEGFVSNGYKFINRMGFARQNLAARPTAVNEAKNSGRVVVVYGGGFQPFHVGHLSSYLQAKKAFPGADIYVAASNDTSTRPIPFDDKKFLAQQAGVADNFVQVKIPLSPKEILSNYDPAKDKFVLVRSERDPVPYTKKDGSPAYLQPMTSIDKMEPFGKHAYVLVTKRHDFELDGQPVYSGTQVRDMYKNADDAGKMKIISQLYPKSTKKKLIKQKLDSFLVDDLNEADNPDFYPGNFTSPIPGTPGDLSDPRSAKEKRRDAIKQAKQARGMRKWMGHYNG